jgi:hypothetical protein
MTSKTTATVLGIITALVALPAFALEVGASAGATVNASAGGVTVSAAMQTRITTAKSHADQEIDRRVQALNDLNTRVQGMVKVSADVKTSISNEVSTEVSNLTTLKAKIDADADIATLKTDIKSITADYRIFMLVIPQGRITVAADRISAVTEAMTTFSGKLQTRITAAQTGGQDVTALSASLTDMNAKIADANVQATAAVSHVSSLQPDKGDKTIMASNSAAIKQSRADLKVAMQDLTAARKDAGSIIAGLKALEASGSASTTTSTSGGTQ